MHRLYLGAEKKMEVRCVLCAQSHLSVQKLCAKYRVSSIRIFISCVQDLEVKNSQLAQRIEDSKPSSGTNNNNNGSARRPQSLGHSQGRYTSVLMRSTNAKQAMALEQTKKASPSPVRSAFTPPGAHHNAAPQTSQSAGFLEMDSVHLDLRSPLAPASHSSGEHDQGHPHSAHTAHPVVSPVPTSSTSPRRQGREHSQGHGHDHGVHRQPSYSRSPVRRSHSVPDMHADKDEVRALDPEEVARRQARAERLRKIVYPVRAGSTERLSAPVEEKSSKLSQAVRAC